MKVRLEDQTCGECDGGSEGDLVTVTLSDENGNNIYVDGKIAEILEDNDPWN